MASASNPEVLQSTIEEKVQIDDIPSKDLTISNHSRQELSEEDDKQVFSTGTGRKPSPTSTETVPELHTNRKANLVDHNLSAPVTKAFSENALQSEASISKCSSNKGAAFTKNPMVSYVKCSNSKLFPEGTGSVEAFSFYFSDSKEVNKASNSESDIKLDHIALDTLRISDASPSIPCKPVFQTSDLPPGSLPKMNQFSKLSYQAMKPPLIADINDDKSLTEILSNLDDWARKGLEKACNRSAKIGFADIKDHFEKDVKYGLSVMKHMTTRIHTLMRAASKLPDFDTILASEFQRGRNRIRGDLITNGLAMWHSIDDIELLINNNFEMFKIMWENVSKLSPEYANDMEEVVNPYNIITNLYTLIISSLLMLRTEMENFHDKIRAFCSDLEGLL